MRGGKTTLYGMRTGISITALIVFLAGFATAVKAQNSLNIEVDLSHLSLSPPTGRYHILRAQSPAGLSAPLEGPEPITTIEQFEQLPLVSQPSIAGVPAPGFFPGDVTKIAVTAKTLSKAAFNPIFINCPTSDSCWGNPTAFLTDLTKSTFIHLTDQYTKAVGSFSLGTSVNATVNLMGVDDCGIGGTNPCLLDGDIQAIVNVVAQQTKIGAGYGHLYHVFLPQNVDVCMTDSTGTKITGCYSPDVPALEVFCAYHSVVDQSAGHLIYSVEPFLAIPGCETAPPAVNTSLADSTDSVLAHETFEAISDPDLDAFHDLLVAPLFGAEIGDICQGPPVFDSSLNFVGVFVPTLVLNRHKYKSQLMYSNHYHACAGGP
jgi:hypothetical protein